MSGPDESSGLSNAMEGLKIINEVECKISCSSSKVIYIVSCESNCIYNVSVLFNVNMSYESVQIVIRSSMNQTQQIFCIESSRRNQNWIQTGLKMMKLLVKVKSREREGYHVFTQVLTVDLFPYLNNAPPST